MKLEVGSFFSFFQDTVATAITSSSTASSFSVSAIRQQLLEKIEQHAVTIITGHTGMCVSPPQFNPNIHLYIYNYVFFFVCVTFFWMICYRLWKIKPGSAILISSIAISTPCSENFDCPASSPCCN